ncbi:hypothetical protein D3C75_791480 [compost metagenome]
MILAAEGHAGLQIEMSRLYNYRYLGGRGCCTLNRCLISADLDCALHILADTLLNCSGLNVYIP